MDYQLQVNYSIPVTRMNLNKEDILDIRKSLDNILDEQIIISQYSNMTFEDTNNMDSYERAYIAQKLLQIKQEEIKAKKEAFDNISELPTTSR